MLRLLHGTGEAEPAADFLHRVVMANYDGAENEALAAILHVIGAPKRPGSFCPGSLKSTCRGASGMSSRCSCWRPWSAPGARVREMSWTRPSTRPGGEVLRGAAAAALSGLRAAFRTESEMRPGEDDDWPPGTRLRLPARSGRAPQDKWIDHAAVCGLLALANRLGLDVEAASAAEAIGDHSDIVTPDRMLPAALELMHRQGALADTAAFGVLWRQAADLLLERSSTVPVEPTNWTIAADIPCKCEFCNKLRAFCEDPVKRLEHFKVRKDLRKHLHQVIDRHRLDLHHVTERQGSPYTLVCTKNRASHERRLDEYAEDLRRMDSLLNVRAGPREAGNARGEGGAPGEGAERCRRLARCRLSAIHNGFVVNMIVVSLQPSRVDESQALREHYAINHSPQEAHMGNLTIRNLDDTVIDQLKAQAKANQRSLEGEVRHVLTREVSDYLRTAEFLERADALATTTTGTKQTDSAMLIREDRDR